MNLLKQITLDLAHVNGGNVIRFHQGDKNAASISAEVYNNGVAYRMTGMTIKYDATIAGYLAEEDADGTVDYNVITIPITENMTALSGKLLIDIKIIDGSGDTATILFTQTVEAFVDKSVIDGAEIIDISGMTIPGRLTALESKFPVGTEDLADGAVTEDKLAGGAVTEDKLAGGAVTEEKLDTTLIETIIGKMDRVLHINNPSAASGLPRDQLFECQGAIGITGHSAGSSYTGLAKQETMDLAFRDISDIRSYLGYPSGYGTGIVGLQVDFANKTFTRLADASSLSAGANFDRFRMYGGRRRCNVADDGTINAYYGDAGYRDDGANGQVMVYQPAFWYRVVPLRLEENVVGYHIRRANYYISETPRPGFKLHPLFYDANGNALEYVLMSAYEASMYDVSASAYVDDTVDSVAYALGDLLCSVAGQKPISGELSGIGTKANFETMAGNRGTGWHLDTVKSVMANQLLMMIEMGSLNMQEAIGRGVVDCANVGDHNTSSLTGATASLGNATGMALETTQSVAGSTTVNTVDGKLSVTYRGMENPWGNLFKHVQGLNLWGDGTMGGGQAYVCSDDSFNELKHDDNYSPSGICLSNQNGYISAFGYSDEEYDWLLLPTETLGNSALPVGDQLTTVSNINRNGFFQQGGDWSAGTSGGMFYYRCSGGMSGNRKNNIGGRLLYIPTAVV